MHTLLSALGSIAYLCKLLNIYLCTLLLMLLCLGHNHLEDPIVHLGLDVLWVSL